MRLINSLHFLAPFLFYFFSYFNSSHLNAYHNKYFEIENLYPDSLREDEAVFDDVFDTGENDSTEVNIERKLAVAIANKDWSSAAAACYDFGSFLNDNMRYEEALESNLKGVAFAQKAGDIKGEVKNLFGLGEDHLAKFEYPQAMEFLLKGLKLSAKIHDPVLTMQLNNSIGMIYKRVEEYEKAKIYLIPAYQEAMRLKTGPIQNLLMNIGNVEEKLGNYRESITYYQKYLLGKPNDPFTQVLSYNNTGTAYLKAKEPAKAMAYFKKAFEVEDTIANPTGRAYSFYDFALVSQATGDYAASIAYALHSLALNQPYKIKNLEWQTAEVLADSYQKMGNYELANTYYKKFTQIKDSISSGASLVKIGVLDAAYKAELETEKKQQQVISLQKENDVRRLQLIGLTDKNKISLLQLADANKEKAISNLQLKNLLQKDSLYQLQLQNYNREKAVNAMKMQSLDQQNRLNRLQLSLQRRNIGLMIIGALLLLVASVFYYRRNRVKKLFELEKLRTGIAADFHDELGSTLSSIALYSEMAISDSAADTKHLNGILSKIGEASRTTVAAMQDMIWSIQPRHDNVQEMVAHLKDYAFPLAEAKNINLVLQVEEQVKHVRLSMSSRKNIYLIFKEALNNAFKYSAAKNIEVRISKVHRGIKVFIADDGKGFDIENYKAGNGLRNMHKRATESNGDLAINSSPGAGTQITFSCALDGK